MLLSNSFARGFRAVSWAVALWLFLMMFPVILIDGVIIAPYGEAATEIVSMVQLIGAVVLGIAGWVIPEIIRDKIRKLDEWDGKKAFKKIFGFSADLGFALPSHAQAAVHERIGELALAFHLVAGEQTSLQYHLDTLDHEDGSLHKLAQRRRRLLARQRLVDEDVYYSKLLLNASRNSAREVGFSVKKSYKDYLDESYSANYATILES